MRKIMIMGSGAQGSTIAARLQEESGVEEIVCADYDLRAAVELEKTLSKARAVQVNAMNRDEIVAAAEGCDLVVNGLPSVKERSQESQRLFEWAFREFQTYDLFGPGEVIEEAAVWQGEEDTVPLVVPDGLKVTLLRNARKDMKVTVRYTAPIPTPIAEGDEIATLVIEAGQDKPVEYSLHAGKSVGRLGRLGRVYSSLKYMVLGGP